MWRAATPGPFEVRDASGAWLAGAHWEAQHAGVLWLPRGKALMVAHGPSEQRVLENGEEQDFRLEAATVAGMETRGVQEEWVKKGLFRVAFGPAYLQGFRAAAPAVTPLERLQQEGTHRAWPWRAWGWAGLATWGAVPLFLVGAAGLGLLGGVGLVRMVSTTLQRPAAEGAAGAVAGGVGSVVLLGAAAVAVVVGTVLVGSAWLLR